MYRDEIQMKMGTWAAPSLPGFVAALHIRLSCRPGVPTVKALD